MECQSCGGNSLSLTDDGKMVCDDCGEQASGYHHEEVDFVLAGTAVSNRQSQSSQAHKIRSQIAAHKRASLAPIAKSTTPPDEVLICEGVFILGKAIAGKLVDLGYVDKRIMPPLFEVITYWVRRRHAGVHEFVDCYKVFQPFHVLSLISLAALYVRSPMLPRDICRLVATRQVPFIACLKTVFPDSFTKTEGVRSAFTPPKFPIARHVIRAANQLATEKYAWPHLKHFFMANDIRRPKKQEGGRPPPKPESSPKKLPSAFPIGHLHITILRLSRLLGLPDYFGARVLRFMELRRTAVKMARVLAKCKNGPWDDSGLDSYEIDHIPSFHEPGASFSEVIPGDGDLYTHPTDESLQVDFVCTMRLCYGHDRVSHDLKKVCKGEEDLQREWEACKDAMMRWLETGNPEDGDNVAWSSLSKESLSSLRGKEMRDYSRLVDDMLVEKGETDPELWGKFKQAFEDIAAAGESSDEEEEGMAHVVVEDGCMYDRSRLKDTPFFIPREGKEAMEIECDENILETDADGGICERLPLRKREGDHNFRAGVTRRKRRLRESDFLQEPAGIGLAWTIMYSFFHGPNTNVSGTDITPSDKSEIDRLRVACDRMMRVVILYILGLKAKSRTLSRLQQKTSMNK